MSDQVSFPFARQDGDKVVIQQLVERWREIAANDVIVMDVEPLKDCLVEFASFQVTAAMVVGSCRCEQLAAMFCGPLELVLGELGAAENALSGGFARGNS